MVRTQTTVELGQANSEFLDGVSFVCEMEKAQNKGEADVVELNLRTLKRLIADLAERKRELDALESRARHIHDCHAAANDRGRYVQNRSTTRRRTRTR